MRNKVMVGIAVLVVLIAVLAAGIVLLVFNKPAATSSTASPSASAGPGQDGAKADKLARDRALFRLPYEGDAFALNNRNCPPAYETDDQVPFEALADPAVTRWTDEGSGIKTPRSLIGHGPNLVNDAGMPICYTKTYEGAALAAMNIPPLMVLRNQLRPASTFLYKGEIKGSKFTPEDLEVFTKGFNDWYTNQVESESRAQKLAVENGEPLGWYDELLQWIADNGVQYKSVKVSSHVPNAITRLIAPMLKVSIDYNVKNDMYRIDSWLIWNNVKNDWFLVCSHDTGAFVPHWSERSPVCTPMENGSWSQDTFTVNLL